MAGGRRAAPALESRLDRQGLRRRARRRHGRSGAGRRPASPSELRGDPLQGRGRAALRLQRHQRAQADGSRAGRGQAHGGCGERGEDAVPGDHEPRDPHAPLRRARHPRTARPDLPGRAAGRLPEGHPAFLVDAAATDRRCARRVEDRSRPVGSGAGRVLAPCARRVEDRSRPVGSGAGRILASGAA
ncbi:hypothetical protein D3C78_1140120 [compost metagenome]